MQAYPGDLQGAGLPMVQTAVVSKLATLPSWRRTAYLARKRLRPYNNQG